MANHTITVNPFNPLSVMRAERLFQRRLQEFDEKVDMFLEALAEYGREVAALGYGAAVDVRAEPIENGYAIIASGQAIGFLEFGAGDTVASGNIFAEQVPYEVRSGSWSETHAHQYETTGRWVFGGVVYTQVTPRNAMQNALEQVQEHYREIAEEIFG